MSLSKMAGIAAFAGAAALPIAFQLGKERRAAQQKRCPKRRFGRCVDRSGNPLMMPVITCGGMRLQETWAANFPSFNVTQHVSAATMENMRGIVAAALDSGITHFETARGYGCSEVQYAVVLAEVLKSQKVARSEIIVQTKVPPKATAALFRAELEKSLAALQVDAEGGIGYIDLVALHGINTTEHLGWIDHCVGVLEEYKAKGKLLNIGFSTHGASDTIVAAIETGKFDYVNLHWHFIGSYTAAGSGNDGQDNGRAVKAAAARDMGVFIISPADKGGMLYKPPVKMARATYPLKPLDFALLWLLKHKDVHTLVVGAARPTDFREAVHVACDLLPNAQELCAAPEKELRRLWVEALGTDWAESWWRGLGSMYPDCRTVGGSNPTGVGIGFNLWLLNLVKAWGLLDFARGRYAFTEGNRKAWDKKAAANPGMGAGDLVKGLFSWNPGNAWTFPEGHPEEAKLATLLKASGCPFSPGLIAEKLREAHTILRKDAATEPGDAARREALGAKPAFDLQHADVPIPDRLWSARPNDLIDGKGKEHWSLRPATGTGTGTGGGVRPRLQSVEFHKDNSFVATTLGNTSNGSAPTTHRGTWKSLAGRTAEEGQHVHLVLAGESKKKIWLRMTKRKGAHPLRLGSSEYARIAKVETKKLKRAHLPLGRTHSIINTA